MRYIALLAVALVGAAEVRADEQGDIVKRQKEKAFANWKKVYEQDPPTHLETEDFLFFASKSFTEKQLQAWSKQFNEHAGQARTALKLSQSPWKGKLAVYLFESRRDFNAFMRSVRKKSPKDLGPGTFSLGGEDVYIAASKPADKGEAGIESQAAEQLVSALLQKFAGENHGIPDWMFHGFVTATLRRTAAGDAQKKQRENDRRKVAALLNRKPPRSVKDLFNDSLTGEELLLVRASVVDYLAYNAPEADKFPELLKAFRSDRPNQARPINDVLAIVKLYDEKLDRQWANWVKKGGK